MSSFYGSAFDAMLASILWKLGMRRDCIKLRTSESLSEHWGTCHLAIRKGKQVACITMPRIAQGRKTREVWVTLVTDILLHEIAHAIVMLDGKGTSHTRGWGKTYASVYSTWESLLEDGEVDF